jgi:hypothetical protein
MFWDKKTKWIPFGNYIYAGNDYIVFVRKNLKTGMLYFKTKRVQLRFSTRELMPFKLIDVEKQWQIITSTNPDQFVNIKKIPSTDTEIFTYIDEYVKTVDLDSLGLEGRTTSGQRVIQIDMATFNAFLYGFADQLLFNNFDKK